MTSRRAIALTTFAALSMPAVARATDMSGLAVIFAGMFVGAPAAVVLLVSIVVSIAARAQRTTAPWHRPWAAATTVVAPLLGLAYPFSMLLLGGLGKLDFLVVALAFDLPVLVLAVVAVVLATRLATPR